MGAERHTGHLLCNRDVEQKGGCPSIPATRKGPEVLPKDPSLSGILWVNIIMIIQILQNIDIYTLYMRLSDTLQTTTVLFNRGILHNGTFSPFYSYYVTGSGYSSGYSDLGGVRWQLALCYLLAFICVILALSKSIKSSGKVCLNDLLPVDIFSYGWWWEWYMFNIEFYTVSIWMFIELEFMELL